MARGGWVRPFAVMVLDLDHFKAVNDRWGHAAGDAVLVEVARRLAANLRAGDFVARIGGEEFLVVLPATDLVDARSIAERLRQAVREKPFALPQGGMLTVTASIGLALSDCLLRDPEQPVAELIDRADQALMTAKSAGRNRVTLALSAA
jgi:two-component system, cell cycle response regulator